MLMQNFSMPNTFLNMIIVMLDPIIEDFAPKYSMC